MSKRKLVAGQEGVCRVNCDCCNTVDNGELVKIVGVVDDSNRNTESLFNVIDDAGFEWYVWSDQVDPVPPTKKPYYVELDPKSRIGVNDIVVRHDGSFNVVEKDWVGVGAMAGSRCPKYVKAILRPRLRSDRL